MHVVFGTGAIGHALIAALAAEARPVRAVNRSGSAAGLPRGVEVVAGDAADPAFATRAAAGAQAVYQCLNVPYHRWAEDFPALQEAVTQAARAAGARYVSFENTYAVGDPGGAPITEVTPLRPCSRKGRVRLAMAERLGALQAAGELEVVTVRSSDFFGPGATAQSILGERVIGAAVAGKRAASVPYPADRPHSYAFTLDAGRTLAAAGTAADLAGEVFLVPSAPARTTRALVDEVGRQLGRPLRLAVASRLALRLAGLANPTIRELDEMRYQFTQPFVVDGAKATARLGVEPTSLPEAIAQTIAWFRAPGR